MKQTFLRAALVGVFCLLSSSMTWAQTLLSGRVLDQSTGDPIIGLSVTTGQGTNLKGVVTDVDGKFSFEVPSTSTVTFRYVGYKTLVREIRNAGSKMNLGDILMQADAKTLDAVTVIASVVPRDRITPVPVSNIKLADIEAKAFNAEFPELMKSTPSVYVTRGGGGFGDSRIALRGFDMSNIGVLINGVPVNDMENGKVYFSNWAGLTDIASFVQIQRGIGASRLGLSSVGGTMNIVTKNVDAKRGGAVFTGIGNDGYLKYGFNVSTGLMDNGWAVTASGSTSMGDGYVRGTNFHGYNYFLNVSKKLNEEHTLSFSAFGAPQWHNQRSTAYRQAQYEEHADGIRMNLEYGYLNGEVLAPRYNYYHKPQISLNHMWKIDDKSSLSTALYASLARGGGRNAYGLVEGKVRYTNWITTYKGDLDKIAKRTPGGLIDWEAVYAANAASANGSKVVLGNSVNQHNWYGLLSTYQNKMTDNFTLTAGFDGRYYLGDHYNEVHSLLGGSKFLSDGGILKAEADKGKKELKKGDIFNYHNKGEVIWSGLFAQGEYDTDYLSGFLSGSLSYQGYRYLVPDLYSEKNYAKMKKEIRDKKESDRVNFLPFSIKGGLSYKFLENSNVFLNAGYFTRAPQFGGTFLNYSTEVNKERAYEKIITAEVGYGFRNEYVKVDLNGYYTRWNDRFFRRSGLDRDFFNFRNLNATHMGLELEVQAKPTENFSINGMISLGDWKWGKKTKFDVYDENQVKVGSGEIDLNGVHVGNAAQFTASLGADWEVFKNLHLRANVNFFGKNYADFEPAYRIKKAKNYTKENPVYETNYTGDSWKLPNYALVDLSTSYKLPLQNGLSVSFFGGVNNLFDKKYIADATDGVKVNDKQVRTGEDALVYYGFGRTWQCGMRVNF
ncbi:MAG: TonB-dependent receptor [Porphyromonas sp.]|nr:TonB-dependent receptor [Porphyromonas sp.]